MEGLSQVLEALQQVDDHRQVVLVVDGLDHVDRVRCRATAGSASSMDPARSLVDELAQLRLPAGAWRDVCYRDHRRAVFQGGKNRIRQNGTWKNAKVALGTSTSLGDPAPLLAGQLGLPAGSITSGMTLGKANITLKR